MSETQDLIELGRLASSGEARRIRTKAGLTARSLAVDLGVTPATINRWETGAVKPSRGNAVAWLELLRGIQSAQEGAGTDG